LLPSKYPRPSSKQINHHVIHLLQICERRRKRHRPPRLPRQRVWIPPQKGQRTLRPPCPRDQPGRTQLDHHPEEEREFLQSLRQFRRRQGRAIHSRKKEQAPPGPRHHPQPPQGRSSRAQRKANSSPAKGVRLLRKLARQPPSTFQRRMGKTIQTKFQIYRRGDCK